MHSISRGPIPRNPIYFEKETLAAAERPEWGGGGHTESQWIFEGESKDVAVRMEVVWGAWDRVPEGSMDLAIIRNHDACDKMSLIARVERFLCVIDRETDLPCNDWPWFDGKQLQTRGLTHACRNDVTYMRMHAHYCGRIKVRFCMHHHGSYIVSKKENLIKTVLSVCFLFEWESYI